MASNFSNSSITFAEVGLQGESVLNPTAVDFSKTGNPVLFVTQQDGQIKRYGIERHDNSSGPDSFVVTSAATISTIVDGTQNYNDDGALNSTHKRQVTGLVTTTDADGNDVLYVSSSDWRISVSEDSGLDTNSGQIHRLVLDPATGAVLSSVAVVRGLPRSEENHANNGLDLRVDPVTGHEILWIAQGGNTNMVAPSDKFAGTVEFALAASILKVDLTAIEAYDVRTDGAGNKFVLDLPTLDDPNRANVDLAALGVQNLAAAPNFTLDDNGTGANGQLRPDWAGGSNGLNMAKIADHALVSEGGQLRLVQNPLFVHSPGFRNPYDVIVTEDGDVYSWDNGPNGGWGGQAIPFEDNTPGGSVWVENWQTELATNRFSEQGSIGFGDQLHYLGRATDLYGPYAGHAHPIRAAADVLAAAFNQDGSYAGATPDAPIVANGVELFANETEARSYLRSLLIIYEEQGDGNWVDIGAPLPADFFDVVSGYRWAHPGSSIADPKKHFDGASVMDGTAFSPESQLLTPTKDGSLYTVNSSTNGLAEYTASFFGGALEGAVLGASFNGSIYFVRPLDTDGNGRPDAAQLLGTINGFGSTPLGLVALGDDGLSPALIDNNGDGVDDFSGVIVAATYGADDITFFIPGGTPLDPSTDLDLDGVNNTLDTHVGDPLDGRGVSVGPGQTKFWGFELSNPASTPSGAKPGGDSIAGDIGINAVWQNGTLPQVAAPGTSALYDPGVWNLGGASTFVSIDEADDGTAEGAANTQTDVIGIGFATPSDTGRVTITSAMANIFAYSLNTNPGIGDPKTWTGGEKVGLVVGPGNQSDFVQAAVAVVKQGGTVKYGIELVVETNDTPQKVFVEIPGIEAPVTDGVGDPDMQVALDIDLNSGAMTVTARARYVDAGAYTAWVETPALALPQPVFAALKGQYENEGRLTGGFVGLLSTAAAGDDSFGASWDWVEVTGTERASVSGEVVVRWNAGTANVAAIDGGPSWIADAGAIVGSATVTGSPIAASGTLAASVPGTTPKGIFAQEYYGSNDTSPMGLEFGGGTLAAGLYAVRLYMGNGYSGTNDPGERVFDVSVENQLFLDDIDLSGTLGHKVGGMFEWVGQISDGTLDIDFVHGVNNPLINGVEVIRLDGTPPPPSAPKVSVLDATVGESDGSVTVTFETDKVVPTGQTVTVDFQVVSGSATPAEDYAAPGLALAEGVYFGSVQIAGGSADATVAIDVLQDALVEGSETFAVNITSVTGAGATVADGNATVTIQDDDAASSPAGVVYRWNAGTSTVAATDGGLAWVADAGVVVGAAKISGSAIAASGTLAASVPGTTPKGIFAQEYWGKSATSPMGLEFGGGSLEAGLYAVRLYMGNGYSGTNDPGERIFDVSVENQLFLDDIDLSGTLGHKVGGMFEWQGTVSDGTLDIDFVHGVNNPLINGVEIIRLDGTPPPPPPPPPSANPKVSVLDATVGESDGSVTVTFETDKVVPTGQTVTVNFQIVAGSATPVQDYAASGLAFANGVYSGSVQIAGGSADATVAIDVLQDALVEGSETFAVNITSVTGAGATVADGNATVTIQDDDAASSPAGVVYRWNAGTSTVAATDGGLAWVADAGVVVGAAKISGSAIAASGTLAASVPGTTPKGIFAQEYWGKSATSPMGLEFGGGSLEAGLYAVRLYMGNGYSGTNDPGERIFDVSVENQLFLDDIDLSGTLGHKVGGMFEWQGTVSDGTLDIDFVHGVNNPLINGVEIIRLDGTPPPPPPPPPSANPKVSVLDATVGESDGSVTVTFETDKVVPTGQTVTVNFQIVAGSATPVQDYAASGLAFANGVYSGSVQIAGGSADATVAIDVLQDALVEGSETFAVNITSVTGAGATVADGNATVTIQDDDAASSPAGVVYRWNAGTSTVAATDGGLAWVADAGVVVGAAKISGSAIAASGTLAASVPGTTPKGIFAQEYWGKSATSPMGLEFGGGSLEAGLYAVRLYMGNGYSGTNDPGERIFDVSVENQLFLDDIDLSGTLGHKVGGMFEWQGTVSDGTLDIDFVHGVNNPLINGVEIIRLDGTPPPPPPSANPKVSVLDATVGESDGSVTVTFETDKVVPTGQTVTVNFQIVAGSATPVQDYAASGLAFANGVYSGSVQIAGGSADATVAIDILQDTLVEGSETFAVNITSVTGAGATVADGNATVTIQDDDAATAVGAATLVVTPNGDVQSSTYGSNSFMITNTGDKLITRVVFDITDALYPDMVIDPFGLAGDTATRALTINTNTSTGVISPSNSSYIGAGGAEGYEGIQLVFDPANQGGFQNGEKLGFSVDLDPNSIAGAQKAPLDAGTAPSWDVGGVSGAELIGSTFTAEFSDGTSATGQLQSIGNQSGAAAIASQASPNKSVVLTVNGIDAGGVGTYDDGGPTVLVQGPAGETARVVLTKGFIQPVTNEFHNSSNSNHQAYAPQLDAQLAELADADFPANNAVEFQTIDVLLDGSQQNISGMFDFLDVAGYTFANESEVPLGFVASVIDPDDGLPLGAVTDAVYLVYDELM